LEPASALQEVSPREEREEIERKRRLLPLAEKGSMQRKFHQDEAKKAQLGKRQKKEKRKKVKKKKSFRKSSK